MNAPFKSQRNSSRQLKEVMDDFNAATEEKSKKQVANLNAVLICALQNKKQKEQEFAKNQKQLSILDRTSHKIHVEIIRAHNKLNMLQEQITTARTNEIAQLCQERYNEVSLENKKAGIRLRDVTKQYNKIRKSAMITRALIEDFEQVIKNTKEEINLHLLKCV